MNYLQIHAIHDDPDTRLRCATAMMLAAQAIGSESDSTPNHAARLLWAQAVAENPDKFTNQLMWTVALDTSVQAAFSVTPIVDAAMDAAVANKVNGHINDQAATL